jgi:hypothetical protein
MACIFALQAIGAPAVSFAGVVNSTVELIAGEHFWLAGAVRKPPDRSRD